jgi:hypothetical protein
MAKKARDPLEIVDAPPDWLKSFCKSWDDLRREFDAAETEIRESRRETEREAWDRSFLQEDAFRVGVKFKPHQLIPYLDNIDQAEIDFAFEMMDTVRGNVVEGLKNEEATPEFISAWGVYFWAKGVIDVVQTGTHDALGRKRSGQGSKAKTGRDEHVKYAAQWIWDHGGKDLYESGGSSRGKMRPLRDAFLEHVQDIVSQKMKPPVHDTDWFEQFFSVDKDATTGKTNRKSDWLAKRYNKNLTLEKIHNIVKYKKS